jgi:hypothetical protein
MLSNTSLHTIVVRARLTITIMIRIIFPQVSFGNGIQNLATNWSSCKKVDIEIINQFVIEF